MGVDRYVKMEEVEKAIEAVVEHMLKPALRRVVEDSSNPYDDATLAIVLPMLDAALDKIDGEEG